MTEQENAMPEPAVPEAVSSAACCAQADAKTQKACTLCGKPVCRNCRHLVNGKHVCATCRQQIEAELAAEQAGAGNLPAAVGAGLAASLVSGAVWAGIVVAANVEVGYVALGVGWLTGTAVHYGSGKKRGQLLQIIAVACSALGLLLGKYFAVVHFCKVEVAKVAGDEAAAAVSYFDPEMVKLFFQIIGKIMGPFDILWLVIALGIAWSIPKPTAVTVREPRGTAGGTPTKA